MNRFLLLILLLTGFFAKAQSPFYFQDTSFTFNKSADLSPVHWYLEIFPKDSTIDTSLRWVCIKTPTFPSQWDINFEDGTNNLFYVMHLDSADFTLFKNPTFPQKLIIGNELNNHIASDTIFFKVYDPDSPNSEQYINFIFNISHATAIAEELALKPYPNPSLGELHLGIEKGKYKLFNLAGELVDAGDFSQNLIQFNQVHQGHYILEINNNNEFSHIQIQIGH